MIWGDVQCLEIADDVINELYLLVHGVRVVKPQDHPTFVHLRIVEVHHGSFHVADVEVARGFGRESCHNGALDSIHEDTLLASVIVSHNLGSFNHLYFVVFRINQSNLEFVF